MMNFIYTIFGVPLGWIMWVCYLVFRNYGIALFVFTLLTKALLFPLSIKQQKASAKMAHFAPKMQQIKTKYANNPQKQQEEMMKLYEKEGYNPAGGCLPLLIQFPLLFGMIDVIAKPLKHVLHISGDLITRAGEIAQNANLLAQPNSFYGQVDLMHAIQQHTSQFQELGSEVLDKITSLDYSFFGIPLGDIPQWGWNILIIVPILSGITSLISSILSMKMNPATQVQQQGMGMMKGMMLIMPIFSIFIAFQVPAGVGLYWVFSNIFMMVQTVLLKRIYNPQKYAEELKAKEAALAEEEKKKNTIVVEEKVVEDGKEVQKIVEKQLSQKEMDRIRLAQARKKMAEKYGDVYEEEE